MDNIINFEFEYFQDEICNLHSEGNFFPNVIEEGNIMNDFPSLCEIDTTEAVKKKLDVSSDFEPRDNALALAPEPKDPYVMHFDGPIHTDPSLFEQKPSLRNKAREEEIEFSKDTSSCTLEVKELGFKNPVDYSKNERFSKKYDKGKAKCYKSNSSKLNSESNYKPNSINN